MAMSEDRSFGELLAGHRAAAQLTQEELADRAGLSVHAISLLERGLRTSPRGSTVALLAGALQLGQSERAALTAAARRRPARPATTVVPPDLGMPLPPLIGREEELARAHAVLARPDVRLLTLTGAPGAGKTRLALELAAGLRRDYEDGVVVAALGRVGDAGLVLPAVRQALGLREVAHETPLDTVARYCRLMQVLLVLDNFEHVRAARAELLELLARCQRLQALVTSRAPLRVRAEHELPVLPLEVPSADQERAGDAGALRQVASVRLFLERTEAAVPGFRLTGANARPVAAICRRLDGLPLALELAAPWLKLLTPDELLERLDHRLELLVEGATDLPERQRTLRAALRWSCELLGP
ncbi:MAG TPA: helix-turn-helix domain-containing protein, partial [Candidatus Eisenbacteria bacterium]|nr:helix-turn-helix domain-containing protein [Candidatus Eisenbacteria bacterium]